MSAGLEVRGNSMRIWWRIDNKTFKETLQGKVTPDSVEKARKLAELIGLEIDLGIFNVSRHFPESRHAQYKNMNYYIDAWLTDIERQIAPSTFSGYASHVKNHVRPKWGKYNPRSIESKDVKNWVNEMKLTLHSKSIREIVTRFSQIHLLWRIENKVSFDPCVGISIVQSDTPAPDPFTQAEITALLTTPAEHCISNLLPCFIWTGLSLSEQLPLAWEDIDLEKGTVRINRSFVRGRYRVTKNRRRQREIKLLKPALEALRRQYAFSGGTSKALKIDVLQRDNFTYKPQRLRFVWLNPETANHFTDYELRWRWNKHLATAKVRKRGVNQGRHTFASQLLTSGQVPPEWIADQLGHNDTSMIYKHYGKIIAEDAPDYASRINNYFNY
jgi:integrase